MEFHYVVSTAQYMRVLTSKNSYSLSGQAKKGTPTLLSKFLTLKSTALHFTSNGMHV